MSIRSCCFVALAAGLLPAADLTFQSPYLKMELADGRPAFKSFSLDSLGKGKVSVNLMRPPAAGEPWMEARRAGPDHVG